MVKKNIVVADKTGAVLENIEVEVPLEGFVESVTIAATLNLGNYNNVKMEISASNADYARYMFEREIEPTIEMVKGIIKKINAK